MKNVAIIKQFNSELGALCEQLDEQQQRAVIQRLFPQHLERLFPDRSADREFLARMIQSAADGRQLDPIDHADLEELFNTLDVAGIAPDETGEMGQDRHCFHKARLALAVRFAVRMPEEDAFASFLYELAYSTEDIDGFLSDAAGVATEILKSS